MSENDLRQEVKRAFQNTGAHLSWIESHATASGFPDLEICHRGISQQIELKYAKEDGDIKIRKSQYLWFRQRVKAGGTPLLWVKTFSGDHFLVPGPLVYEPKPITNVADIVGMPHVCYADAPAVVDAILRINRQSILTKEKYFNER